MLCRIVAIDNDQELYGQRQLCFLTHFIKAIVITIVWSDTDPYNKVLVFQFLRMQKHIESDANAASIKSKSPIARRRYLSHYCGDPYLNSQDERTPRTEPRQLSSETNRGEPLSNYAYRWKLTEMGPHRRRRSRWDQCPKGSSRRRDILRVGWPL